MITIETPGFLVLLKREWNRDRAVDLGPRRPEAVRHVHGRKRNRFHWVITRRLREQRREERNPEPGSNRSHSYPL